MDYLSSKKERTEVAFSSIPEEGEMRYLLSDDYPLGSLLEHELEEEIHHAIRNLPEVCRKVFIKSRFEGKKYEEIATELNISVNTVKYHIKSALSSLHSELGKYLIILILFFRLSNKKITFFAYPLRRKFRLTYRNPENGRKKFTYRRTDCRFSE